jgi:hypothetical protein
VWGLLEKLKQRRKFGVDDLFLLGKREKGMRTDVVTTPVTIELPLYAKERRVSKLWVEEIERPSVLTSEKFCRNVNGEGLWGDLLLDDGLD